MLAKVVMGVVIGGVAMADVVSVGTVVVIVGVTGVAIGDCIAVIVVMCVVIVGGGLVVTVVVIVVVTACLFCCCCSQCR